MGDDRHCSTDLSGKGKIDRGMIGRICLIDGESDSGEMKSCRSKAWRSECMVN